MVVEGEINHVEAIRESESDKGGSRDGLGHKDREEN
jgi:hypothetical protein